LRVHYKGERRKRSRKGERGRGGIGVRERGERGRGGVEKEKGEEEE